MNVVSLTFIFCCVLATTALSETPNGIQCHDKSGYYENSDHQLVHRPECTTQHLVGETAICRDGSHSFSKHHAGTCSHHGGVAQFE